MPIAIALPLQVRAWGAEGHRLIAEVAETELSPSTKAAVNRLLAIEPGATLASISTWADDNRTPVTAPWHYVNLPRDSTCRYEAGRDCAAGSCVVAAIERQAAVLASNAPDETRLKALKYVVHFVADVHQPLHAGFADDRGGNTYQLQAVGRGSNLHAVWDTALIQQWPGGAGALRAEVGGGSVDTGFAPGRWAEESCRTVASEGFYPSRRKIDERYVQLWRATLSERITAAAHRLATVLNQSLADK